MVFKRPRKLNQWGTYPLAMAGWLVMKLPSVVYELAVVVPAIPFAVLAARVNSTTVTADGVLIRSVRARFVPWDQIKAITVADGAGDRSIDLRLVDGSHRRLPAPVERHWRSHDAEFDAKYAALMQAWLRSSGPGDDDRGPGRKRGIEGTLSRRRPE
ncbi:hypothetical protein GCM10009838_44090 [Catenulispora subtropica]|uniref:DUF304 domain-containing protein n=1 Tax=Catenulispora subtropica TaxID=450798 RepID=A0ABN2S272_9ACTN